MSSESTGEGPSSPGRTTERNHKRGSDERDTTGRYEPEGKECLESLEWKGEWVTDPRK